MVYGIGIDIVSVDRMKSICSRSKRLLKDDLFSEGELLDARIDDSDETLTDRQIGLLASKFAAKEAAVKAIKLPLDISFNWSDIVITGKDNITIELHRNIKNYARRIGILRLSGSASISNSYSVAIVKGEPE